MIDTPYAMHPRQFIQRFDQGYTIALLAIQSDRDAMLEGDLQVGWSGIRGAAWLLVEIGVRRPGVDLLGRLRPGIFQDAALDTPSPQVLIDRVRAGVCHLDGNAMLGCVSDFVVACHTPLPHGSNDFQCGRKSIDRYIEANLVVAFACAAVGHRHGSLRVRCLDKQVCDQRAGQRRCQGILALVDRSGL